MILRRVTEHVKAQNWFAVGIDFLIVVLDIQLAFQKLRANAVFCAAANAEIYSGRDILNHLRAFRADAHRLLQRVENPTGGDR